MSDNTDHLPVTEDELFETAMRGYNRRQVDEFADRAHRRAAGLEGRLSRALGEAEQLRAELAAAQQAATSKPAHEEISDRTAQILQLAGEEARAQTDCAAREITQLRWEAQEEADARWAEATSQAERMLAAAREQADRAIATARAEAEKTSSTGRAEAEHTVTQARTQAQTTLAEATTTARELLDEAAARAAAIRDGAENRLSLLTDSHSEVMRRLSHNPRHGHRPGHQRLRPRLAGRRGGQHGRRGTRQLGRAWARPPRRVTARQRAARRHRARPPPPPAPRPARHPAPAARHWGRAGCRGKRPHGIERHARERTLTAGEQARACVPGQPGPFWPSLRSRPRHGEPGGRAAGPWPWREDA